MVWSGAQLATRKLQMVLNLLSMQQLVMTDVVVVVGGFLVKGPCWCDALVGASVVACANVIGGLTRRWAG